MFVERVGRHEQNTKLRFSNSGLWTEHTLLKMSVRRQQASYQNGATRVSRPDQRHVEYQA
jgi:hypothetical protein